MPEQSKSPNILKKIATVGVITTAFLFLAEVIARSKKLNEGPAMQVLKGIAAIVRRFRQPQDITLK